MSLASNRSADEQPLRFALPACYEHLQEQFALHHIHPYDVKASSIAQDGGYHIVLRYGEGMSQSIQRFFLEDAIARLVPDLTNFYLEAAQLCKKTLIADYYKMIKP